MNKILALLSCSIFVLGLAGCQNTGRGDSGVEVIVEGGGEFPEFLVGRWKANKIGWEFVFEPDGMISSAIVGLDRVKIVPGQSKTVPRKNGGKGVHKPGLWTVQYSTLSRELAVEIVMDHTFLERGPMTLEGKTRDIFVGEVLEDGRIWETEWFTFPDYIIYDPEYASEPNIFKLELDPNKSLLGPVTFEKFEE